MSFVETVGKFHISLDGIGLLLQGAGEHPVYRVGNAPVYGTRFASGDRDYNDLSQWWYFIQTDWSGGIKDRVTWEDDAKFYYSTNIDARTSPGEIKLEHGIATAYDNTANDVVYDVGDVFFNETTQTVFLDGDNLRLLSDGTSLSSAADSVNGYTAFANYLWLFYDGASANGGIRNFDGTTESNKTTLISSVVFGDVSKGFGGIVVGETLYMFVGSGAGDDYRSIVKTTVADPTVSGDFSLVWERRAVAGAYFVGFEQIGGEIIFGLLEDNTLHVYALDISSSIVVEIQKYSCGGSNNSLLGRRAIAKLPNGNIAITIVYSSSLYRGNIYEYNGSTITKIFESNPDKNTIGKESGHELYGGCVVFGEYACWGNLIYDGSSFFNFVKNSADSTTDSFYQIGFSENENKLYFKSTTSGRIIYSYDLAETPSSFKTGSSESAFLIFSQHDKLQSIDKLLNSITIGFKSLLSGQSIEVYYTTSETPAVAIGSWTHAGTASYTLDGGSTTYKTFVLPDGVVSKKLWFRVNLKSGGSNTPVLTDFTAEYLPMPDYRLQWTLKVNCSDEVKRIDGRKMEVTARELKSRLIRAWQTKSALDFGDIDYAQTAINDATPQAADTTITVDSTAFFPEQGRIKIGSEEIYYTGKTPTSFTGCTRGARGTLAVDHADNDVVHNGYRVLVIDIDVSIPVLLEDKHTEWVVGLVLREV